MKDFCLSEYNWSEWQIKRLKEAYINLQKFTEKYDLIDADLYLEKINELFGYKFINYTKNRK